MDTSTSRTGGGVRSIFISDVHLGSKHARVAPLVEFLNRYEPRHLYLVGDFVDGWRLRRRWHWPANYNLLLHRLVELSRRGTQICDAPGNHDDFMRHFLCHLGLADVSNEFVHETADGRRFLVTHGDQFDTVELRARWLSVLGATGYDLLLAVNRAMALMFGRTGTDAYRLCAAVKQHVKTVVRHVSDFECLLAQRAKARGCDGVVCGHIHVPAVREEHGVVYCNSGDWIENCTALVEHPNGTLAIVDANGRMTGAKSLARRRAARSAKPDLDGRPAAEEIGFDDDALMTNVSSD